MSLLLKGNLELECNGEDFVITELTGLYHATNNTTGYETPNDSLSDLESATLVITNLTTGVEYDEITFVPSSTYGNQTTINVDDIKLAGVAITEILDGRWQFYITAVINGTSYTLDLQTLVITDLKCGLKNVILNWCEDGCNCQSGTSRENMFIAYAKWIALSNSLICSDGDAIDTQLESIGDFLESLNCNC